MSVHSAAFAEIDVCPRCGGAFLDAGEGVAAHGVGAEPSLLVEDGRAQKGAPGSLRCPGEHADGAPPKMEVWQIGDGDEGVELDWCRSCGGFFLDAGEGVALLELATRTESVIRSAGGARFAAPPTGAEADVVDAYREKEGRGFFSEMVKGLAVSSARYRRMRRRRHGCEYDDVFRDGWRW